MNLTASVIIVLYYIFNISFAISLYARYRLCPELMWCAMQLLMFFGITSFQTEKTDIELLCYYLVGLLCFMIFSGFGRNSLGCKKQLTTVSSVENYNKRKPLLIFIIVVAVVLCGWFFAKAGGNVFVNGLRALINNDSSYSTKYARMGILSISGVGYIYQIRVMILPLAALYYFMMNQKKVLSYILMVAMLLFLVGTGQRGGLVSILAIYVITIIFWNGQNQNEKNNLKNGKMFKYFIIISVSIGLFALSTVLNGRVQQGGTVLSAIYKRLIEDNQSSAIDGFRYIKHQKIQYGTDWMLQLADILPGKNDYVSLATRIFASTNGGSMAGTEPACIWGCAYYNFGVFGVIFIGCFVGFIAGKMHSSFSSKICDELDIITYSSVSFLFAYWVADGPIVLFNNGFVATLLLYVIMKWPTKK